ncbi:type V CRISPR-associated protein Cas4 [bacterium]|nr:type V CRISPR-associated protein Cas4 [bacterium]
MESYIQISKLNDFIFCPHSLYLHSIYDNFNAKIYHGDAQIRGKIVHECIDEGYYSTAKKYLSGIEIYSQKYGLAGKIDIYDSELMILIERKNKIKKIYDGYKYQLYAQYFCLLEMGFLVKKMCLHSLKDNKRYWISLPDKNEVRKFEKLIEDIGSFDFHNIVRKNKDKCKNCIYNPLCIY